MLVVAVAGILVALGVYNKSGHFLRQSVQNEYRQAEAGMPVALLQAKRPLPTKALLDEIARKELELRQIDEMEKTIKDRGGKAAQLLEVPMANSLHFVYARDIAWPLYELVVPLPPRC
jgi:hypothetical protein